MTFETSPDTKSYSHFSHQSFFKEAGHKIGGKKNFHDLVLKQIIGLHFERNLRSHLQREPQAQRCQRSEHGFLCSPQFTEVTSHHLVQAHLSSADPDLALSSACPSRKIHAFLCLSGLSLSTVSTSLRAYI